MDSVLINRLSQLGAEEKAKKIFIKYSEAKLLSEINGQICKYTKETIINILNSIKLKYGDKIYEKIASSFRDHLGYNVQVDMSYTLPKELESNLQKLAKFEDDDDDVWPLRKKENTIDISLANPIGPTNETNQKHVSASDFFKVVGTSFLPFMERKSLPDEKVEISVSGNPRKWTATLGYLGLLGRTLGSIEKLKLLRPLSQYVPASQIASSYLVPYVSEEEPDVSRFWLSAIWKEWKDMFGQLISSVPNLLTTDFYKFTYYGAQPTASFAVWFYLFGRYSAAIAANLSIGLMETAARGVKLYGILNGDQKLVSLGDRWAYRLNVLKNNLNLVRLNLMPLYSEKKVQDAVQFARHVFRDEIEKKLNKMRGTAGNQNNQSPLGLSDVLLEIDTLRKYVTKVLDEERSGGETHDFRFRTEREKLLKEEGKKTLYGFLKAVSGVGDIVYKDMSFFVQELNHLKEETFDVIGKLNLKMKEVDVGRIPVQTGTQTIFVPTRFKILTVGKSGIPLFYGPDGIGNVGRIWLGLVESYSKISQELPSLRRFSTTLHEKVKDLGNVIDRFISSYRQLSYRNGIEITIKDNNSGKSITISNHDILKSLFGLERGTSKVPRIAEGLIAAAASAIVGKLNPTTDEASQISELQEAAKRTLENNAPETAHIRQVGKTENDVIKGFFEQLPERYSVSAYIISDSFRKPIDLKASGIIDPQNPSSAEREYAYYGLLEETVRGRSLQESLKETREAVDPVYKWIELVYGKGAVRDIGLTGGLFGIAASREILQRESKRIEELLNERGFRKGIEEFVSPKETKDRKPGKRG